MKNYTLIVEYSSGKIAMTTETSDLQEALNQFMMKMNKNNFYKDKGYPMPMIYQASIVPQLYETEYHQSSSQNG